jgi:hypothetical protein
MHPASARSAAWLRPYRLTVTRRQVALPARSSGSPSLAPLRAGPAGHACPSGVGSGRTRPRCPGRSGHQQRPAVVGRVADSMDWSAGNSAAIRAISSPASPPGWRCLARPQPEQHQQAHRRGTEGEADRDPGDHPPVAPADLPFAVGGPVMGPERVMDLAAHRRNRVSSATTTTGAPGSSSRSTISHATSSPSRSASQTAARGTGTRRGTRSP